MKEQLLYEVHDPAAYLTPDVVADLSEARVVEVGGSRPRRRCSRPSRPATLKVNVFCEQGWFAEGEIRTPGRAPRRVRASPRRSSERLGAALRVDLIGVASILGDAGAYLSMQAQGVARDVRLRPPPSTTTRLRPSGCRAR